MQKQRIHHLLLLMALIFGSGAAASPLAEPQANGMLATHSLHLLQRESFEQVGLVEVGNPYSNIDPMGTNIIAAMPPEAKVEMGLALASLLPHPISTGSDIAALANDLKNGNWGMAALSALAAIPIVGDAAVAGKVGAIVSKFSHLINIGGKTRKCPLPPFLCFTEGTLVTLADGSQKPVEQIAEKDVVLAWDEANQEFNGAPVVKTFQHQHQGPLARLTLSGGENISCSPEHPFLVLPHSGDDLSGRPAIPFTNRAEIPAHGVFLAAQDLRPGDLLHSPTGAVKVESLKIEEASLTLYNFEVQARHTFLVGKAGVVVHNTCILNSAQWKKVKSDYDKLYSKATAIANKGITSAHLHHIVYKGKHLGTRIGNWNSKSQEILERNHIDINSSFNLTWAQNAGHSVVNAMTVYRRLAKAEKDAARQGRDPADAVMRELERIRNELSGQ